MTTNVKEWLQQLYYISQKCPSKLSFRRACHYRYREERSNLKALFILSAGFITCRKIKFALYLDQVSYN